MATGLSNVSDGRTCTYANMTVPNRTKLCHNAKCMLCKDGDLQECRDPRPPRYGLNISVAVT
ncbi:MAG: hypothetical protein ACLGPL_03545 [Acidobacteriota bacterium]